jgi:hypothetical protein
VRRSAAITSATPRFGADSAVGRLKGTWFWTPYRDNRGPPYPGTQPRNLLLTRRSVAPSPSQEKVTPVTSITQQRVSGGRALFRSFSRTDARPGCLKSGACGATRNAPFATHQALRSASRGNQHLFTALQASRPALRNAISPPYEAPRGIAGAASARAKDQKHRRTRTQHRALDRVRPRCALLPRWKHPTFLVGDR